MDVALDVLTSAKKSVLRQQSPWRSGRSFPRTKKQRDTSAVEEKRIKIAGRFLSPAAWRCLPPGLGQELYRGETPCILCLPPPAPLPRLALQTSRGILSRRLVLPAPQLTGAKHRDGCCKEQIICDLTGFGLQTIEMSYLWLREIYNVMLGV